MTERIRSRPYFGEVAARRYSRRELLQGFAGLVPTVAAVSTALGQAAGTAPSRASLNFEPITGRREDRVIVPDGYVHDVVASWGQSLHSGIPDLDPRSVARGSLLRRDAAERQMEQVGYNCDAVHFFPTRPDATRGVLCINNEYTNDELLFPGRRFQDQKHYEAFRAYVTKHPGSVRFAQAAHGITVCEIERVDGHWRMRRGSPFNRRVTAATPIDIAGPARAAGLLRTSTDPEGTRVAGTLANCAGGRTPWATYLSAEENLEDYFGNFAGLRAQRGVAAEVMAAHRRFWLWERASVHGWEFTDARFDVGREPTEPLRFGWIVELDPFDTRRPPCKRTALGRFAHEAANPIVSRDGRVAVYMGDDEKFEYVYKFVSRDRVDPTNRSRNRDLLDHGTLYAARFDSNGTGEWLPLVWSESGALSPRNGFRDPADLLIRTRAAADVLGATPMDRPEDVEPDPATGRVYIACTKNEDRRSQSRKGEFTGRLVDLGPNHANPRGPNPHGHVIELTEDDGDHTGRTFRWELFVLAGDPSGGRLFTRYEDLLAAPQLDPADTYFAGVSETDRLSPIGCPDNVGFDPSGNLWITTDGDQPRGANNGTFACATQGPARGALRQFMSVPLGAEVCGCEFAPDGTTLFLSIQHPGEGGDLAHPLSRWPDGGDAAPRPSVIAIRREDGGPVGS
jgi:secreted PhoX family phosphatase